MQSVKTSGKTKEYIESVGLNDIEALHTHFAFISNVDPSVDCFYTRRKSEFQTFLDKIFKETEKSEEKIIIELVGDADFIRDEKRQMLYKRITDNGVKMQILMDIQPWTLKNAELLRSVGAEVMHQVSQEHYHFGVADSTMFSLYREPATEESLKVVSLPQHESLVKYWFVSTNQRDAVEYVSDRLRTFKKTAKSFDEIINESIKKRK